jgi:AcrR family transcriptional regulator
MPRPRFRRLAREKRERILKAAAREFAAYGYEGASLNKILEEAQISKGAAYYYFDDKADLFATTVEHYASQIVGDLPLALENLEADTFWSTIDAFYCHQFTYFRDRPWAFGVVKAGGRLRAQELAENEALSHLVAEVEHNLLALLHKGQALGVVRTDLPADLLAALFIAVDDVSDRWLLQQWQEMDEAQIKEVVHKVVMGLSRLLAPPDEATQ